MCRLDWWIDFSCRRSRQRWWSAQTERPSSPSACSWAHWWDLLCRAGVRAAAVCPEPQFSPRTPGDDRCPSCHSPDWERSSSHEKPTLSPLLHLSFLPSDCASESPESTIVSLMVLTILPSVFTSSNIWYLVSLWMGLIRRSFKRNLNPYFNLISWKIQFVQSLFLLSTRKHCFCWQCSQYLF